ISSAAGAVPQGRAGGEGPRLRSPAAGDGGAGLAQDARALLAKTAKAGGSGRVCGQDEGSRWRQGGPVFRRGVCLCLVRGGSEASEKSCRRRSELRKTCRRSAGALETSRRQRLRERRAHE